MADPTRTRKPDPLTQEPAIRPESHDPGAAELRRLDAALQRVIDETRLRRQDEIGQLEHYDDALGKISHLIHQVNNPLTSLLGRIQILRLGQELDPRVAKASDVIEESAQRIADDVKAIARIVQTLRQDTQKRRTAIGAAESDD